MQEPGPFQRHACADGLSVYAAERQDPPKYTRVPSIAGGAYVPWATVLGQDRAGRAVEHPAAPTR